MKSHWLLIPAVLLMAIPVAVGMAGLLIVECIWPDSIGQRDSSLDMVGDD